MICYQCGCSLSEHDFCTNCGADVALYKKIIYISNRFYNEGLERANVRDLTGAITSLRQSLKFNKNNVEARNLLGLVYFETGEVVAALSEWVISKNLRPKKNIADDYIDMIQTNQNRLDTINQTIKKYNQALTYCNQDSLDLAVIQLKKVLSLNPKFIRAHQLLALLYINSEEWERARRELTKCREIDTNNTATQRYLKEVEEMLVPEEGVKQSSRKKQKTDDIVKYQSGNETIIQPVNIREGKGVTSLLNLGIGVIIGIAIAIFLILPARIQASRADIDEDLRKVSEQSDAKTATIDELQQQVNELTKKNGDLQQDLEAYLGTDGKLRSVESLLKAADAYLTNPEEVTVVADYLEEIVQDDTEGGDGNSESFEDLYNTLLALVGPSVAQAYYDDGYEAYRQENYADAILNLEKAFKYDAANGDALYNLANSYYRTGEEEKAKDAYLQVIELFPNTEKASKSEAFLEEMENAE
ncbi:MAG: tetratricopeptide repeat protein [Lachnospiraceae bacterium]|jgi:Flp pilus assembly protein TadD|nr:tetratricopeptide repeat protein [uncultured Schaedlerella sp.]MCI8897135.1 tetratricopeptide repeat protein [Lachnospiraceae bacterium]MCI9253478.1 tetratricopeptide repeat protein [Lachnospiraceae bacterium]